LDVGSYDLDTTRRSSARLKIITEQLFEPRDPRRPNGMGACAPDAARQAAALGHLAGECRLWTALRPAHRAWTADSPPPNIPTASTAGERMNWPTRVAGFWPMSSGGSRWSVTVGWDELFGAGWL